MHRRWAAALLLAFTVLLPHVSPAQTDAEKGISWFDRSDPEMNRAMQKARDTLPVFRKYLSHPPAGVTSLQLKVALRQGDEVEHVWLADLSIKGEGFSGTIANQVEFIPSYQKGQRITVQPGSVSDWMVVLTNGIRGGYSIQVILAREKPADPHELIGDLADLPFLDR